MSVSLVIPAYNEYPNLTILIKEINQILENSIDYEVIIVDDCSIDETNQILKKNNFKNCNLIFNEKNLGQSFSIIKGIENAQYDTIVTLDADLQNNPNDILKLYNAYISNPELKLVGGIRLKRKDNITKIISSKIANKVRSLILNDDCPDTGCSLKIFDKKIFLSFPFFNGIHRFLPALFKGFNHQTLFIEVDHRARKYGISKYGTLDRLFRGIRDLIKVNGIIKNNTKSNGKLY